MTVTFIRQPGELVKAGDVVVQFDTTQQEYNLREAEADLAEAQQKSHSDGGRQPGRRRRDALRRGGRQDCRSSWPSWRSPRTSFCRRTQARDNEIALEAARNRLRQAEQDLANKKDDHRRRSGHPESRREPGLG